MLCCDGTGSSGGGERMSARLDGRVPARPPAPALLLLAVCNRHVCAAHDRRLHYFQTMCIILRCLHAHNTTKLQLGAARSCAQICS